MKRMVPLLPCTVVLALVAGHQKLSAAPGPALSVDEPKLLNASVYARDHKKLLFNFKRVSSRSGSTLTVQRDFTYPDGRLAAREILVYQGEALVSYDLDEAQLGAKGSATIRRASQDSAVGSIEFEYSKGGSGRPKAGTEPLKGNVLTADTVGPFLAAHWEELQRGEKLKCRYVVVPRAETVGFTFVKEPRPAKNAPDTAIVKMEATSPFVSTQVDPLFFTIEQAPPHRVLQYVGRTTPKVQVKGKWQDLDAVTVFDWQSAR